MKKYLFVLCLLYSRIYGQDNHKTIEVQEERLYHEILSSLKDKKIQGIKKLYKKYSQTHTSPFSRYPNTWLLKKYKYDLISLYSEYKIDEATTSFYGYDISIISNEDKIIYYNILSYEPKDGSYYCDNNQIEALQSIYAANYYDTLNISELEEPKGYIYGKGCGISGSLLKEREELESALEVDNIDFINKWFSKPFIELKLYAYEGLLRLEKNGIQLTSKQLKLINEFKEINEYVNICGGCIVDKVKLIEAINDMDFKN